MRPLCQRLQRQGFNGDGRTDRASLQGVVTASGVRCVKGYSVKVLTGTDARLCLTGGRPLWLLVVGRYNNLELNIYRNGAVSGKTDSPRGYFEIPTWRIFIFHVGKKKFLGDFLVSDYLAEK